MSDENTPTAAKFRKLANRLHRGWAELHPATAGELEAVRRAVRLQWEKAHEVPQSATKSKPGAEHDKGRGPSGEGGGEKPVLPEQPGQQSREQDHGRSH